LWFEFLRNLYHKGHRDTQRNFSFPLQSIPESNTVIAVIDYKAGNITSVKKALDALGAKARITDDPEIVARAEKIMLPGVGHFAATEIIEKSGMRQAVEHAIGAGVPFFGICVGMQWMLEGSEEAPEVHGLGTLHSMCERFPATVKAPHVGWNQIRPVRESRLLRSVEPEAFVYYSHSYRAPITPETVAVTEYGGEFSAVVERDNTFGVQFHPEKSAKAGMQILKNFVEL
jgi:glutamine amidotransferase